MGEEPAVIGISASVVQASWTNWNQMAVLLPLDYSGSVQRAGGVPVLLAPDARVTADPDLLLDRLDGLLVSGGCDMDPATYGAERDPLTDATDIERDRFEIALTLRAVERGIPVLGVCRGMQVLNVAYGGTLIQHLPDRYGHEDHRPSPGTFSGSEHEVRLEDGSLAATVVGERCHTTFQHHHQGVDRLGDGLVATGWAVDDGLVEAIELPASGFVLGVEWHPEADSESPVIGAFVAACG